MTRRRSFILAATVLLLAALLVFMPLRVAVGGNGVVTRKVDGKVAGKVVKRLIFMECLLWVGMGKAKNK